MTNSFSLGKANSGLIGVFKQLSRLNHSCEPNAKIKWNKELAQLQLHATKDIEEGEEITVSYFADQADDTTDLQVLRALHWDALHFECICKLCQSEA